MLRFLAPLLAAAAPGAQAQQPSAPFVRHELEVRLDPERHALALRDLVTLPARTPGLDLGPNGEPRFTLSAELSVEVADANWTLVELAPQEGNSDGAPALKHYELQRRAGATGSAMRIALAVSGTIENEFEAYGDEGARSFADSAGTIGPAGVYLSGASGWLPHFAGALMTFRMQVELPPGWDAVSQGRRIARDAGDEGTRVTWDSTQPMEEIYLVANRFVEYSRQAGDVVAQVFLREPDPELAAKYLEATGQYIDMYRDLIGPYPFPKFALVENFWETGYGMPSFTLLGSSVIRLPFILHSSYPHEILHNWWGNSVYVASESGNWCEGLTAYLADHLVKEGQEQGVEYRRDTLKKYRDYVQAGHDFPLTEFRSRHSSATEAVGYGKALMLFHMLRREIGDQHFIGGLRRFYEEQRFERASWSDLEATFTAVSGRDLAPFFAQWLERTGAPELAMAVEMPSPGALNVRVDQTQAEDVYALIVPLAITMEGEPAPRLEMLPIDERSEQFELELEGRILRVDLDPYFDVFRRLHREELPPTLGELFGAPAVTIVVPTQNSEAWTALAESWQDDPARIEIVRADGIEALPADRCVWVLGRDNVWAQGIAASLPGERASEEAQPTGSFAYAGRHPADPNLAVGWIGTHVPAAIPGLARKLPHYGKYGYLGFVGDEPTNVTKGQWTPEASPLVAFPEQRRAALPERDALARPAPSFDPERLRAHVAFLASDELEGRGLGTAGIESAAEYIAAAFREAGLQPGGDDGTYFQTWTESGGPEGRELTLRNVVGVLPGTRADFARQSIVLGAHYDHLGRGWPDVRSGNEGAIHNGADDNASGVAVLIECARTMAEQHEPQRSLVFVAFSGEEWGLRGSRHYVAADSALPAAEARAMINLDAVGRMSSGGLTVLGCGTADEWVHIAMGVGFTTGVKSTCVATDPGGSDQVSFHERGVPAVQLFTGAHEDYHRPSDDLEKIDADGLAQVAVWVREALVYLAEREEPLTSKLAGATAPPVAAAPSSERRVSLGTVPSMTHTGPGVLIDSVLEGSPAAKAGVQAGDMLVEIDGEELEDLRAFSEVLKRHKPGDVIRLVVERDGQDVELEATLVAR